MRSETSVLGVKIAIATINKKVDSKISSRGGRAPYYLIFNEKAELLEVVSNPFSVGGGGAGVSVAKMLADMNVEIVIAGKLGDKMTEALKEKGIKFYEKEGIAKEIINTIV